MRLLNRTTKSVGLTAEGQHLLKMGSPLVDRLDELRASVRLSRGKTSGMIRVGVPHAFGRLRFLPVVMDFHRAYPDIQVSLSFSASRDKEHMARDALDVKIMIAEGLEDSSLIALPLGDAPQALVASPDYLRRAPALTKPEDLMQCNCLVNVMKSPSGLWRFERGGEKFAVRVQGSLHSDMGDSLKAAALMGFGLSIHPYYMVLEEVERGLLRVVLPSYTPSTLRVYAVFPSRERMPLPVRKFIDFLTEWAKQPHPWTLTPGVMQDA
nr:substrate binding domain-containing protein [Pseudomonas sp.]